VSAVARAREHFAKRLEAAGFDDAMSSALTKEPVLCGDETPVNIARKHTNEDGTPMSGALHVDAIHNALTGNPWVPPPSGLTSKINSRRLVNGHKQGVVGLVGCGTGVWDDPVGFLAAADELVCFVSAGDPAGLFGEWLGLVSPWSVDLVGA
jgi:hypothetical protein